MNEDYCSYELSKALKAAGFDEPCDHYYCAFDNETDVRFWSIHPAQSQNGFTNPDGKVIADAPTLWHAQKWLREKWNIYAYCEPNCLKKWFARAIDLAKNEDLLFDGEMFDNFEKATEYAISAALELIEKGE